MPCSACSRPSATPSRPGRRCHPAPPSASTPARSRSRSSRYGWSSHRAAPSRRDTAAGPRPAVHPRQRAHLPGLDRTALALIVGGLAAGQLLDFHSELARLVVALPPVVLGGVIAVTSHGRWRRAQ